MIFPQSINLTRELESVAEISNFRCIDMFQSIATLRFAMFQSIATLRFAMIQSIATLRIDMFQAAKLG